MAANPNGYGYGYQISSSARNKLNAFLYKADKEPDPDPSLPNLQTPLKAGTWDKENQVSGLEKGSDLIAGEDRPSAQSGVTKHVKECPQTPANRIPLADLIGNTEDAFNKAPKQEHTPVEHVVWQHVPPSSSSDASGMSSNRGRKRQRSSSPSDSPLSQNPLNSKEPFDLQSFQALLKTPQNDLAAELWNSYVGKNSDGQTLQPQLAHLHPSSPQTPAPARMKMASPDLRRSSSCNADFPNSHTKRRRMRRDMPDSGRNTFSRSKSNILDSSSKINSLLEIIEKNIQKPPDRPAPVPSSSPPLPMHSGTMNRSRSPSESKKGSHAVNEADKMEESHEHDGGLGEMRRGTFKDSSSDYGDDEDFDQELLEIADASMNPLEDDSASQNKGGPSLTDENSRVEPQQPDSTHGIRSNSKASVTNMDKMNDLNAGDGIEGDSQGSGEAAVPKNDGNSENISAVKDEPHGGLASASDNLAPMAEKEQQAEARELLEGSSGDEFDDDELDIEAMEQSMSMVQCREAGSGQVCRP